MTLADVLNPVDLKSSMLCLYSLVALLHCSVRGVKGGWFSKLQ